MKTMKSKFGGSPNVVESSSLDQLISNETSVDEFSFYNTEDCYVRINKSSIIFLFAGQGFETKENIFSFEVINALAIRWEDSSLWDDTLTWNDILVVSDSGIKDSPDFNYMRKT